MDGYTTRGGIARPGEEVLRNGLFYLSRSLAISRNLAARAQIGIAFYESTHARELSKVGLRLPRPLASPSATPPPT